MERYNASPDALAALWDAHHVWVRDLVCRKIGRASPEVEDLVSTVFERVVQDLRNRPADVALRKWIGTIAINAVIDWQRKPKVYSLDQKLGDAEDDDGDCFPGVPVHIVVTSDPLDLILEREATKERNARVSGWYETVRQEEPEAFELLSQVANGAKVTELAAEMGVTARKMKQLIDSARSKARKVLNAD